MKYKKSSVDYNKYLHEHNVPLNSTMYPISYLHTLFLLNEGILIQKAVGAGISEGVKEKNGKNIAFWKYLSDANVSLNYPNFIAEFKLPNNLASFCKDICKGDLNVAIHSLDTLGRNIIIQLEEAMHQIGFIEARLFLDVLSLIDNKEVTLQTKFNSFPCQDSAEQKQLLKQLNQFKSLKKILIKHMDAKTKHDDLQGLLSDIEITCSFIRDVSALVKRSKTREDHTHKRWKESPPQLPLKKIDELDPYFENGATRLIQKLSHIEGLSSKIIRIQKPLYPLRKNIPSPLIAGFCLVCHLPSNNDSFYCSIHTDLNKRKVQRDIINKAFDNLGYLLPHERQIITSQLQEIPINELSSRKEFNKYFSKEIPLFLERNALTSKDIFTAKAFFLADWASSHPMHKKFLSSLHETTKTHTFNDLDSWSKEVLPTINKITALFKIHDHMRAFFPRGLSLLQGSENELNNIKSTLNTILESNFDSVISPNEFVLIIIDMSIFKLIRHASYPKNHPQITNSQYKKECLLKNIAAPTCD